MTDSLSSSGDLQLRRGLRGKSPSTVSTAIIAGLVVTALGAACSPEDRLVNVGHETAEPSLIAPDASDDVEVGPTDVPMCPVTTCTLPWTTCPSSEFPCSTNLLTDVENCGGCGMRCPRADLTTHSSWTCVDGKCNLICEASLPENPYADCDGDFSNGCEASLGEADNCGICGNDCSVGSVCKRLTCVDACESAGLPNKCYWAGPEYPEYFDCVDFASDDSNCGDCYIACDPADPTLPSLPADMVYGCSGAKCGAPKCSQSLARNCNGLLEDGCEVTIHTDANCAGCNDTCSPGTHCRQHPTNMNMYVCLADAPPESCDSPNSCGTCGHECPGLRGAHFNAACTQGICGGECQFGYADCNNLLADGCEVNARVDNRNCGACGNACLPEQVCFQGTCQVAPCDGGVPGGATK